MSRKEARDLALKIIYQNEFQKDSFDEILNRTLEENEGIDKDAKDYVLKVTNGINENVKDIELNITKNLKDNWNLTRISKLNIAILKIAIFELVYLKGEIPPKVAINEALEFIELYGELNDKSFVNGILAKVLEENKEV